MLVENKMTFGLSARDLDTLLSVLVKYPEVTDVRIFGSRAKGNYETFSDIDLAVMNQRVDNTVILNIKAEFEDSSL